MNGIYPIVDVEHCARLQLDPVELARALLAVRPAILQLRAKGSSAREVLMLLRELRSLCDSSETLLFANDRPDLAQAAGCDGVHLGQDDLPIGEVRRFAPGLRVGLSTHNLAQLRGALEASPDYVALGPLFPTRSKLDTDPQVDGDTLRTASELARKAGVTLVGIGGITEDRLSAVARHLDMAAMIDAVTGAPALQGARLAELQRRFALATQSTRAAEAAKLDDQ